MIHRQGWTLVLDPDGTTTAWNKDRTKVLHSYDKREIIYRGTVDLASIRIWLRDPAS